MENTWEGEKEHEVWLFQIAVQLKKQRLDHNVCYKTTVWRASDV